MHLDVITGSFYFATINFIKVISGTNKRKQPFYFTYLFIVPHSHETMVKAILLRITFQSIFMQNDLG